MINFNFDPINSFRLRFSKYEEKYEFTKLTKEEKDALTYFLGEGAITALYEENFTFSIVKF